MTRAIYPGSFDPATYGHLDIIKRAAALFDEVIVGVLNNSVKSPLFSVEERVNILENITGDIPNVKIQSFGGLSVNFAKSCEAKVIIRGLRQLRILNMNFRWPRPIGFCQQMWIPCF